MNRAAQLRVASRNYDNASPTETPDFDYSEADDRIASDLIHGGGVSEVVMEVRNAADFLNWIAYNVDLPARYRHEFRELDRRAKGLSSRAAELAQS